MSFLLWERGLSSLKQKKHPFVNCRLQSAELVTIDILRVTGDGFQFLEDETFWTLASGKGNWLLKPLHIGEGTVELQLDEPFPFGAECYVVLGMEKCLVMVTDVVRTEQFDEMFFYGGNDLGVQYTKEESKFAVWAPTATEVNVICFDSWHQEHGVKHACYREEKGVWRATLTGDQVKKWYKYEVCVNQHWHQVVDPYAKFLSVNGERAMIGSLEQTEPASWPVLQQGPTKNDVIIYELHIRDFTIGRHNGIQHKGRYLGLTEVGTKDQRGLATGLDYLKELGVTHVELLPLQEFGSIDESDRESAYNWGYDTTHFFVPEGSYATDPYDGYCRVRELKSLIAAFHSRQIKVIMDVVFNHLYIREQSALEKLVPGYYFRYHLNGEVSNGTGVGNDFASERNMARKIIIDAVCYWLDEFQVDGFRFDLMGILDQKTMSEVATHAKARNRDVFLLGEGWDLPTAYPAEQRATINSAKSLTDISFFQDHFRDALKGSTFAHESPGYIGGNSSNIESILNGLQGSPKQSHIPSQSIHYVEAHDNHTLWDKIGQVHPEESQQIIQKRHRLATAMVLLAQGVPFLHAGQEWFRTKYGRENSYNAPDWINQFNWEQRALFQEHVQYIRALIAIRRHHPAFRMESFHAIDRHFNVWIKRQDCVAYHLKEVGAFDSWNDVIVIHNASSSVQKIPLPKAKNWQVFVDDQAASLIPLYSLGVDCASVMPLSTLVCAK